VGVACRLGRRGREGEGGERVVLAGIGGNTGEGRLAVRRRQVGGWKAGGGRTSGVMKMMKSIFFARIMGTGVDNVREGALAQCLSGELHLCRSLCMKY